MALQLKLLQFRGGICAQLGELGARCWHLLQWSEG